MPSDLSTEIRDPAKRAEWLRDAKYSTLNDHRGRYNAELSEAAHRLIAALGEIERLQREYEIADANYERLLIEKHTAKRLAPTETPNA